MKDTGLGLVCSRSASSERLAALLDMCVEDVLDSYQTKLQTVESPLVANVDVWTRLRIQTDFILKDAVRRLRGEEVILQGREDRIYEFIEASYDSERVRPGESLRAAAHLPESALSVVAERSRGGVPQSQLVRLCLAIHYSVVDLVAKAADSYGDYLIRRVHESHRDERKRISRELHDRVAHPMAHGRHLPEHRTLRGAQARRARESGEQAQSVT